MTADMIQPRPKIIRNAVKCKACGDEIESKHVHDFVSCKCGNICVDGGHDYLRRVGNLSGYEELSLHDPPTAWEKAHPDSTEPLFNRFETDKKYPKKKTDTPE